MELQLKIIVLHSQNLNDLRSFYESLLQKEFTKEKHDAGPEHYSCQLGEILMELYPTNRKAIPSPALGFNVSNLDKIVERMHEYISKPIKTGEHGKLAILNDPDGRKVLLYGD